MIGSIKLPPLLLSDRAIDAAADQLSPPRTKFALVLRDGRLWVFRQAADRSAYKADDIVATFLRGSDPDWLADEIAYVREAVCG